ncbi:MAG: hypothetical protein JWO57_1083 [Pseudonocardiales bacterium]|nr:hypothetical protein [Pseudonocardiales bacterium]
MHDKRSFELVFQPTGLLRQAAFMCEARVFDETYGVALPEHIVEFAPYEDASAFIAVVDDRHDVVAAMRLITPSPVGLKTIHESCGEPWHLDGPRAARAVGMDMTTTWDIATLGVPRGIGRHRFAVTAALYHGLVIVARENNVRSIVMNVDERVRTVLNMTGLVTNALPGAKPGPFCGSPASTPVYAHCAQMLDTQRRINPDGYRLIAQGIGLDAVSVPSAANFVHMPGENDRVLLGSTRTAVPA